MGKGFEFDFGRIGLSNLQARMVWWLLFTAFILIFLFSSFFTVGPEEAGVIQRFGKFVRTPSPCLNMKWPFIIETVKEVTVEGQLKEEFGFCTRTPDFRTEYSQRRFQQESLILTGDLNASGVEWIVRFRIADPYQFLFKVRNAIGTSGISMSG